MASTYSAEDITHLKSFLTVQLEADVLQAHSSEQHALPLSVENHTTHAAHQRWIPQDCGAVLGHVVLPFQEVLQPFYSPTLALTFLQQQQLSKYCYLPPHTGRRQRSRVLGAAGSRQVSQKVRPPERGGWRVVRPREDIGALWVHAHIGAGLKEQVQAGFTVWREDERLHATTLTQHASPWEVTEHMVLERRQEGLHANGGAGAATGLGGDAVAVVLDGELGHLTLPVAIVEDEQGEAGVAEQAPGLGRVRGPGQRQERGVLLTAKVEDQTGEGGEQR